MLARNLIRLLGVAGLVLLGATFADPARAQLPCESALLQGSASASGANFGTSIAMSGNFAIVGSASETDDAMVTSGAAYIFERTLTGWVERARLLRTDGQNGDEVGRAVAIAGDVAIVGAPGTDRPPMPVSPLLDSGAAMIFRRTGDTWSLEATLRPSDAATGDRFGSAVAIEGEWALIGAEKVDLLGVERRDDIGAVYVFRKEGATWVEKQRIIPSEAKAGDSLGFRLVMEGEWAIVSSPTGRITSDLGADIQVGTAYVLHRDVATWNVMQRLVASDQASGKSFGFALSIRGEAAAITDRSNASQRAYVFRRDGMQWVEEATFRGSDTAQNDQFGSSIAIDDDLIVVGAVLDDDNGLSNSGTVFVFERGAGGWAETGKLFPLPADRIASGRFGNAAAIEGNYVLCSSITGSGQPGSVFAFTIDVVDDCNANSISDDCEVHDGSATDANGNGTIDSCECTLDAGCNDDIACTTDSCNQVTSRCVFTINAGFCLIGGQCFATGTTNPANECQVCNSAALNSNWSSKADGVSCTPDANDCTDDVCAAGACTHPNSTAGTPCGSPADTDCNNPDTCDGSGLCLNNLEPDGTPCTDDGLFCTGLERCTSGMCRSAGDPCTANPVNRTCDESLNQCVVCLIDPDCDDGNDCTDDLCVAGACQNPNFAAGTACGDQTNTDCTNPDSCNGSGVCQANHEANGTPCTDDGVFCNGDEFCQGGVCQPSGIDPCAATPATPTCDEANDRCIFCQSDTECDDGLECTDDFCDADGLCVNDPLPGGTACGDPADTDCTNPDTCDGAGVCLSNHEANGTACTDDGLFCTGLEQCQNGVCQSAGNPCTGGTSCNEDADKCDCTTNQQCSDGLFCNGVEVCDNGTCGPGAAPCSGVNKVCIEATDQCVQCTVAADCNDGLFCTGTKSCVSNICLQSGNPCTAQGLVCNENADRCDCDDHGDCSDGLFCNGAEQCVNGVCQPASNPCAAGTTCDERDNRCIECQTGAECNDGNPCTADTCPNGQCVHTVIAACRDTDGDGVNNEDDRCPGTPPGSTVDADGCAVFQRDTDDDGVTDDMDLCPNTPVNERVLVDEDGCSPSQLDDDGDGVSNAQDQCPQTPAGQNVDAFGCSSSQRDDDGDGVPNGRDFCPNTPLGSEVDDRGCAASQRDADGDGVPDGLDLCPGTPPGSAVDSNGCPIIPSNDNNNGNGNANDNDNDNGSGRPTPVGPICGLLGMLNWVVLCLGLVGMRRLHRRRGCVR